MAYFLVLVTCAVCIAIQYFLHRSGVHSAEALASASPAGPNVLPGGRVAAPSREAVPVGAGTDAHLLKQIPRGVFLAPGHTWLQLERSGGVRLGSDHLPLTALGRVDRLEIAPEGTRVRQGDVLARLGLGKRGLRLLSPVGGTVTAVNRSLLARPNHLHADPYETGWFCSIRPERLAASLKRMVIDEETEEWMRSELRRLRDMLSSRKGEAAALADGGTPVQGLASCLEQEEWEDFVERFFEAPARPGNTS